MEAPAPYDRTLKALSLVLSYPTRELQEAMPEIAEVFARDRRLPEGVRQALSVLIEAIGHGDLYDLEENYVALFDRSRTLSLNLFEHVHGESRDRGSAMVSLLETYRAQGYEPASSELPDHLPMLLEFLSLCPFAEAQNILADAAHIFEALNTRLVRKESPYHATFKAILHLAGATPNQAALAELLEQPEQDPGDFESLDKIWEESEVRFGPNPNADCPQTRELLAKIDQPMNATTRRGR